MTLHSLLTSSARQWPDALAVDGPDQRLTYQQLDAQSNGFASLLQEYGVQRGDRVGIWLEKSTQAVVAMQAILRLGAVYVPLDPLSPLLRIQAIVRDCTLRLCVTNRLRAGQSRRCHACLSVCRRRCRARESSVI